MESPKEFIYQWEEGIENIESYQLGGYHPVHIGDKYHNEQYEIVHKLGFGSYSTVWLARDQSKHEYVALKILVAENTHGSSEVKILRALSSGNPDHPGKACVASLLDEFTITGPNGKHLCLVTEAASCSIAESKEAGDTWKFSVDVARSIVSQAILGLDYIHSCGIVHGGKLSLLVPISRF
jgi:serine/threonine-protein kinase SRPK3